MNCASILPLVFLSATTISLAQSAANTQNASLTRPRAAGIDCPVGMQATHGPSLPTSINAGRALRQGPATNGKRLVPQPPVSAINQQIHLIMTNLRSRDIVGAQLTAHGFSSKPRTIDADASQGPDLTSSVKVVVDVKGNRPITTDLSLSHFTAVTSIDLDSITYADGSTWRSASAGACSVVPDKRMLIAATN